jgi:ribosome maturation factor RimP
MGGVVVTVERPCLFDRLSERIGALGYECAEILWVREEGHRVLRISVDSPSGVGVDDCGRISRGIGDILDEGEADLPQGYFLEVGSPGPLRPLNSLDDFVRFVGRWADLRIENRKGSLRGRIKRVDGELIFLARDDGTTEEIPYGSVRGARLAEDPPSPGGKGRGGAGSSPRRPGS